MKNIAHLEGRRQLAAPLKKTKGLMTVIVGSSFQGTMF
jgi:hypothetical protein